MVVSLASSSVCVDGTLSRVCVGGCLHPLQRVTSPPWKVFTAMKWIRREGRGDYWPSWEKDGKRALAFTPQHCSVVCCRPSSRLLLPPGHMDQQANVCRRGELMLSSVFITFHDVLVRMVLFLCLFLCLWKVPINQLTSNFLQSFSASTVGWTLSPVLAGAMGDGCILQTWQTVLENNDQQTIRN